MLKQSLFPHPRVPKQWFSFSQMDAHRGIEAAGYSISLVHGFTDRQQRVGKSDHISQKLAGVLR
jgi:hypothetical protein